MDDVDRQEAEAFVHSSPEGMGPHVILDQAEAVREALVPPSIETEKLAGRIALSLEETRLALGIGERTLKTALRNGEIPSVKIGGRRLVPIRALERHLEALAYAESGALDAWQTMMVKGTAANIQRARRQAVARRKRYRSALRKAHATKAQEEAMATANADLAREITEAQMVLRDHGGAE